MKLECLFAATLLLTICCKKDDTVSNPSTPVSNEIFVINPDPNLHVASGQFGQSIDCDAGLLVIAQEEAGQTNNFLSILTSYKTDNLPFQDIDTLDFREYLGWTEYQNFFGYDIDLHSNTLIVGRFDYQYPYSQGAYIFNRKGIKWILKQNLNSLIPNPKDGNMGEVVLLDNSIAFVSNPTGSINANNRKEGVVYIFTQNGTTWQYSQTISASNKYLNDNFGKSISYFDSQLLVGAPYSDIGGLDRGAAYLYNKTGNQFTEFAKLLNADGNAGDNYGASLLITKNYVFVSAPKNGSGIVYVYDRISLKELKKLSYGKSYNFGFALNFDSENLYVSSDNSSGVGDRNNSYGGVFVFDSKNDFKLNRILRPTMFDFFNIGFGYDVCFTDKYVVVSHPNTLSGGLCYVFDKN